MNYYEETFEKAAVELFSSKFEVLQVLWWNQRCWNTGMSNFLCVLSYRELVKVLNIKNQCRMSLCQTRYVHRLSVHLSWCIICVLLSIHACL
jgi:hypothetical protein